MWENCFGNKLKETIDDTIKRRTFVRVMNYIMNVIFFAEVMIDEGDD